MLSDIIMYHHKITPYHSSPANEAFDKIVNAVRIGDWIDATQGLITNGFPRDHIHTVEGGIANEGFHQTLAEIGPRIYGNDYWKIITEIIKIYRF